MAIFSPALVVATAVLFVFTRIHDHMFIFEVPLFFGLYYCMKPEAKALDKTTNTSSSSSTSSTGTSIMPSSGSSSSVPLKGKLTMSSLPLRRQEIGPTFFASQAELPYLRALHHMLSLFCAYVAAAAFEGFMSCRFPTVLLNKRSIYVALFTTGYALTYLWRLSLFLSSVRVMLLFTALSALLTLFVFSAGDVVAVVRTDSAFAALRQAVYIIMRARLRLPHEISLTYAGRVTAVARVLVIALASALAAAVVVPARRFSMLDYRVRQHFMSTDDNHPTTGSSLAVDPYALPPPTTITVGRIAADYAIPMLSVTWLAMTPRSVAVSPMDSWRLLMLLCAVCVRAAQARLRLQSYLDGAVDAYRRFWRDRTAMPSTDAAHAAVRTVLGTTFYLPMLGISYTAPLVIPVLLLGIAMLDGDVGTRLPFCKALPHGPLFPAGIFVVEIASFLAWLIIMSYLLFSALSFATEVAFEAAGFASTPKPPKLTTTPTASQRRRQKRFMQQQQR